MKLLFDQNISHKILNFLSGTFPGSTTLKRERLINAQDFEIWEYARKNAFAIVTQDADFNDLNSLYGFPPKIIWMRTGNLKTEEIADILMNYSEEIKEFANNDELGCFEILKLKNK